MDGHVLSTRSAGKDVWYLPGGKREAGESDVDTLVREVREELAVRIDPASARHVGTFSAQAHGHTEGVEVRMACYDARHEGTITASAEIAEIGRLTLADLGRVSPVDRIVFAHPHDAGLLTG